uniref:Uncharacterized protein n=1 Tax=Spongospora subterranea TaxID=70186 RepID=A0A0H5R588_9EUKA|eukprot:CRZ03299.1 hypothetical protein [Spongospora subterranea]
METAEGDRVCSINLDQIQNHPASDIATTLHHCLCSFPSIQPIFCPPSDAPTLSQECDNSSLCAIDQFIDMELYLSLIAATSDQQFSCLKSIPNIAINELDGHQDRLDHICCFFRNLLTSPFIRNSLGTSFARICPSDTDCRTRFDLNCCLPAILMEYELSFQFFHSMHSNGILSQVSVSIESVEYLCMNMIRQILRVSNGEFIDIFPAHQIMTLYIDPIISVICHLTLPSYSTVDRLIRSVAKLVSTIESHSPIVVMVSVTSILTHLYNYPDVFIRSMSAHIESCTSIYRMEDLSTIKNGVKLDSQAGPVVDDCATLWCSPDSDSLSWEGQISRYTHELLLALLDMMNSHGDSVGSGQYLHDTHPPTVFYHVIGFNNALRIITSFVAVLSCTVDTNC